jgi:hypothetical protein
VPWTGPVLGPVIVSVVLVAGALLLWRKRARGETIGFPLPLRMIALVGGILVLGSFMLDFQVVVRQMEPPPFRWVLFGTGVTLALAALGLAFGRRS